MVVDVFNIPNVDIVSPTYLHEVSNTKTGILSFVEDSRLSNMFVMNSENWLLIITTVTLWLHLLWVVADTLHITYQVRIIILNHQMVHYMEDMMKK